MRLRESYTENKLIVSNSDLDRLMYYVETLMLKNFDSIENIVVRLDYDYDENRYGNPISYSTIHVKVETWQHPSFVDYYEDFILANVAKFLTTNDFDARVYVLITYLLITAGGKLIEKPKRLIGNGTDISKAYTSQDSHWAASSYIPAVKEILNGVKIISTPLGSKTREVWDFCKLNNNPEGEPALNIKDCMMKWNLGNRKLPNEYVYLSKSLHITGIRLDSIDDPTDLLHEHCAQVNITITTRNNKLSDRDVNNIGMRFMAAALRYNNLNDTCKFGFLVKFNINLADRYNIESIIDSASKEFTFYPR